MSTESLQHACSILLRQLAEPAVRSLALGCFAAAALAILRVKNVTLRLTAWKTVLCVALAMPMLGWLLPALPFSLPIPQTFLNAYPAFADHAEFGRGIPSHGALSGSPVGGAAASSHTLVVDKHGAQTAEPARHLESSTTVFSAKDSPAVSTAPVRSSISWLLSETTVYFAMVLVLLARSGVGIWLNQRLIRSSSPIRDPQTVETFSHCAFMLGLSATPQLAESDCISVPVTIGVWNPIILFPAEWRDWSEEELRAVLAHELSHCARHDALVQRLALLHRAIFWFSPFSWWLNLHIAELAEEASDEAVLATGADRDQYAGTLLNFFAALETNSGRVWWHGMSMAKTGTAERRVDRILAWKGTVSMNFKKSFLFAILAVAVPIVFVAAAARPVGTSQKPAGGVIGGVVAPAMPPAPVGGIAGGVQGGVDAPAMPSTPAGGILGGVVVPEMPELSQDPASQKVSSEESSKTTIYVYGGKESWHQKVRVENASCSVMGTANGGLVVLAGDSCTAMDFDGNGGLSIRAEITEHSVEFWHDGKQYVIHEQATVDRARKLFEPLFGLSEKQRELGKQQEVLGEKQSELADQMSEVRLKMPDLTAELKAVEAKMRELREKGGTPSEFGELQSQLGEIQSRIGEIQSQVGEQQGEIGEKQGELGEKQGELGEQQGKLGEEQAEISKKAAHDLKKLLDEAVANAIAKPEARIGSASCVLKDTADGGLVAGEGCTATDFDRDNLPSVRMEITEHTMELWRARDSKKLLDRAMVRGIAQPE